MVRGWLSIQPEALRDRILGAGQQLRLDRGDYVFREGDPPGGVYGIASGGIGAWIQIRGRGEVMAHIMRQGHWFGMGPLNIGGTRTLTFRATETSLLVHLPLARLRALEPETAVRLAGLSEFGAREIAEVGADLLIRDAGRRIAATLLRVTRAQLGILPDSREGYSLTQAELGEMANASRSYTNRTLDRFQAAGWARLGYNRIAILDAGALADFAAGGPLPRAAASAPRRAVS